MSKISNLKISLAKYFRKNLTDSERKLWDHLKSKQLKNCKFRKQSPIGVYIVDFVCFDKKIIIEVDGGWHSKKKDNLRDDWLENEGFQVLRFWNSEVLENLEGVLQVIDDKINSPSP